MQILLYIVPMVFGHRGYVTSCVFEQQRISYPETIVALASITRRANRTGLSPKIQLLNKVNCPICEGGIALAPRIPFPALESTSLIPSARA